MIIIPKGVTYSDKTPRWQRLTYFMISVSFKLLQTNLVLAFIGGGGVGFSVDLHIVIPNFRLLKVH